MVSSRSLKVVRQADRCGHEGRWALVRACATVSMWAACEAKEKKDNIPTEAGGQVEGGERKYGQGFDGFQVVLSSLGGKAVSKCVQTRGERPSPGVENWSGVFCFCVGVG